MASTWTLKANGNIYGPYTLDQMRTYVNQGRLAAHSLVARTGSDDHRPAAEYDDLAPFFRSTPQRPVFFTAEGDVGAQGFGRSEAPSSAAAHFIIIADMKSRSISGVEEEIFKCGQAYAIMPQAWLLSSDMSINAIRNALVQKLGRIDMLFIIDASRNKAAWFNYGPEADARIRRIWLKTQEQQVAE